MDLRRPQLSQGDRLHQGGVHSTWSIWPPQLRDEKRTRHRGAAAGRAQHRPHLREDLDPDPVGLRGRRPTTRARTSPTSGPGETHIGHKEIDQGHGPGPGPDVRRHRVPGVCPARRRDPGHVRRRPGLERSDRPVAPHPDAGRHPHHARPLGQVPLEEVPYCYLGDARNNTANSLLVTGALLGMDVRLAAPDGLWPSPEVPRHRPSVLAAGLGGPRHVSPTTRRGRGAGSTSCIPTSGSPWASRTAVGRADHGPAPLPGQHRSWLDATGNPDVRFLHCLPACHTSDTEAGRRSWRSTDCRPLEVTDEVFESPASIVFDQAENRLHTIKAIMVATHGELTCGLVVAVGGNALLERGEGPEAEIQEHHALAAVEALAPLAADARPRDHPRQRAPGRPAGRREHPRPRPRPPLSRSTSSAPRPRG